jgi:NAD+ kinase
VIIRDPRNPVSTALAAELAELDTGEGELVVVLGGDGFLLRAVHEHGLDRTYLGINAGHLGFLMNPRDEAQVLAHKLKARAWHAHSFDVLEGQATTLDGTVVPLGAINDIYLERSSGQAARLSIRIDGHTVVEALGADGVILATALGSTAYSFSAGNAPHHPMLSALLVTPICPHLPRLSPFALPASARVEVEVLNPDRRPVRAVADGRSTEEIACLSAALSEDKTVRLAWFDGHDFTRHLVTKILAP